MTVAAGDTAHVIVIGGGLAGLTAAIEATQIRHDVRVTIVEKEGNMGGNSMRASSGISALTRSTGDTADDYAQDTLTSGGGLSREDLVHTLVNSSEAAIGFLQALGVDLSKLSQLGGHSHERTHCNATGPNIGAAIMKTLMAVAAKQLRIAVLTGAQVKRLITEGGAVSGVVYADAAGQEVRLESDAVIIATGGFGANFEALKEYCPTAAEFGTTNGPWATGDGMFLGRDVGAKLVDMGEVQVHPTGFVDLKDPDARSKFLAPERLRGSGGILVNSSGSRFVDELQRRDVVTAAVMRQEGKKAWLVSGSAAAEKFGKDTLGFYAFKQLAFKVDNAIAAAERMGVDADVLQSTLQAYNKACDAGTDEFGKKLFPNKIDVDGEMWVACVTPVVHYCMGGLAIDAGARVLRDDNATPISRLFAAGETTGGLHGKNRLAGNSLLDCVVFGRLAARSAVAAVVPDSLV